MESKNEFLRILLSIGVAGIFMTLGLIALDGTLKIYVVVGSFTLLHIYISKTAPHKINVVNVLAVFIFVVILFIWLIPKVSEINDYRAVLAGIGILIAFTIPVAFYLFSNRHKDLF